MSFTGALSQLLEIVIAIALIFQGGAASSSSPSWWS